jgi:hypothetical protein
MYLKNVKISERKLIIFIAAIILLVLLIGALIGCTSSNKENAKEGNPDITFQSNTINDHILTEGDKIIYEEAMAKKEEELCLAKEKKDEEERLAEEQRLEEERLAAELIQTELYSSQNYYDTDQIYYSNDEGLTKDGGVNYYNGSRETWYSSNELYHYRTPEWSVGSDGVYRDGEGYIVVARSDMAQGSIIDTSLGVGKVYDCGCAVGTTDIYTNW